MVPKYKSIIMILWITTIQISTQLEYMKTLIKQFQLTNLHLIGSSSEINLPFIKSLFVSGHLLNIQSDIYKNLVNRDRCCRFKLLCALKIMKNSKQANSFYSLWDTKICKQNLFTLINC